MVKNRGKPHSRPIDNTNSGGDIPPPSQAIAILQQPVPPANGIPPPSQPKDIPSRKGHVGSATYASARIRTEINGTDRSQSRYQMPRWRLWRPAGRQQRSKPRNTNETGYAQAPWRQMISSFTNAVVTSVSVGTSMADNTVLSGITTSHPHSHSHTHPTHPPTTTPTKHSTRIPKKEPLNSSYEVIHRPHDEFTNLCPSDEEDSDLDDDVISLSDSDSASKFDLIETGDLSPRSRRLKKKRERENKEIIQELDDLGEMFEPTIRGGVRTQRG